MLTDQAPWRGARPGAYLRLTARKITKPLDGGLGRYASSWGWVLAAQEEEQMPSAPASFACCDRCANLTTAGLLQTAGQASALGKDATRRRLLKAAVFRPQPSPDLPAISQGPADSTSAADQPDVSLGAAPSAGAAPVHLARPADPSAGFADTSQLPRTVSGTVLDVSPHVLVIGDAGSEQRFTLTPDAVAWRGTQLEPAALREGDHAVVRLHPSSRHVADRIWANIGRVTGIIMERSGSTLLVHEGATRKPRVVAIQPRAVGRIQVRFPTLEPGYLVDIIGLRRDDELVGMTPATSQPAYPANRLPEPALVSGHIPNSISGSATWHEPRDEPPGILGVAYPALDPETGCAEETAGSHHGFARMPYLAIGSILRVRNDCTGADCLVPVTGCAAIARLFNDRCVTCGTSPRGRVADLTLASFIALGGELERGCFNATITIGE
jgi:hypothetical protein